MFVSLTDMGICLCFVFSDEVADTSDSGVCCVKIAVVFLS